jgi:adenylosuccinate synthase
VRGCLLLSFRVWFFSLRSPVFPSEQSSNQSLLAGYEGKLSAHVSQLQTLERSIQEQRATHERTLTQLRTQHEHQLEEATRTARAKCETLEKRVSELQSELEAHTASQKKVRKRSACARMLSISLGGSFYIWSYIDMSNRVTVCGDTGICEEENGRF